MLSEQMAKEIDKDILNTLRRMRNGGLYDRTIWNIKQTIREDRLSKLLDKDGDV